MQRTVPVGVHPGSRRAYAGAMRSVATCALALVALDASAFGEVVTARQADDGQVYVTLTGVLRYCDAFLGGFNGDPQPVVLGNELRVTSEGYVGECPPPPPPPWVPPPPVPYTFTENFGVIPVGEYDVTWRIEVVGGAPPIIVTTNINVLAAPLVAPIPLPLGRGVRGSALLLFGVGLFALRRRGWA